MVTIAMVRLSAGLEIRTIFRLVLPGTAMRGSSATPRPASATVDLLRSLAEAGVLGHCQDRAEQLEIDSHLKSLNNYSESENRLSVSAC